MTATYRTRGARAVARHIRAALRRRWPGVRFTVRAGRGEWSNWVIVAWHDGPPADTVRTFTDRYQAMSHGSDHRGPVIWAVHGVLITREISTAGYHRIADAFDAHDYPVPRTRSGALDWREANRIDITPPVRLFAPFPGTYATSSREPIPLSLALAIVADSADLSPKPRGRRGPVPAAAPFRSARRGVRP